MIFESTDIFLQLNRNNTAPGLIAVFLLPLGEFNLFNDGERNVASSDRIAELGSIEGNNDTEKWINATANLEIEYFVVLEPTGITNSTLVELRYWLLNTCIDFPATYCSPREYWSFLFGGILWAKLYPFAPIKEISKTKAERAGYRRNRVLQKTTRVLGLT